MQRNVFIVLPKYTAYAFKSGEESKTLRSSVLKWYEYFRDIGFGIRCFAEDMAAVDILGEFEDIKWVSTIDDNDSEYIKQNVEEYPERYWSIKKIPAPAEILKKSKEKYKTKPLMVFKGDIVAASGYRFGVLTDRIRYVADEVLSRADVIVYYNSNNNFCKQVSPTLGDGKLIVTVKSLGVMEYFMYGGIPVKYNDFDSIVRSLR